MSMTDAVLIAWDAYVAAGHRTDGETFRSCVRRFEVTDRWAVVRERLDCDEWPRFRLGCLGVWQAVDPVCTASPFYLAGVLATQYPGHVDAAEAREAERLRRVERHHWCGMQGRPSDVELVWIMEWLDSRILNAPMTTKQHRQWYLKHASGRLHSALVVHLVATLDRWCDVSDEQRTRWTRQRGMGLGDSMSALSEALRDGFEDVLMNGTGATAWGAPFVVSVEAPTFDSVEAPTFDAPTVPEHRQAGGTRGWPGRGRR